MYKRKIVFLLLLVVVVPFTRAQIIYEHISNEAIYDFLDELESEHVISINSSSYPLPRKYIGELLTEARNKAEELTLRQQKEVDFYLRSFGIDLDGEMPAKRTWLDFLPTVPWATSEDPMALIYKDTFATITLKPILGWDLWTNENGFFYDNWRGAAFSFTLGKSIGAYAALRDHSYSEQLINPNYLHRRRGSLGAHWGRENVQLTEIIGGITYDFKFGSLGLLNEHLEWGVNYAGSNIISSDQNTAIPMIKLQLNPTKWFQFDYFHGWLASNMIDSTHSYFDNTGTYREVFVQKYIAGNLFTIKPWPHSHVALGNTVVYADQGVHPAFLNPVLFYRTMDYNVNNISNDGGTNGQMFASVSTRYIQHLHVYGTLFIDELAAKNMFNSDNRNWVSTKLGFSLSNLLKDTRFTLEYTRTSPFVYEHYIESTTYATNQFNLGHYLGGHADELYLSMAYRPISRLLIEANYVKARKGFTPDREEKGYDDSPPFMGNQIWGSEKIQTKIQYQFSNNAYVTAKYKYSDVWGDEIYTPKVFSGLTHSWMLGVNVGF